MADGTKIEWTEATWNPITGCSVVSPGCTNCYAMRLAGTRMKHHESRIGLTDISKAGPVWNGQVRFNEQWLDQPLRWRKPRMIFVCAHGDLFHENVPDEWIDQVFAVMALAPQHTFQVLTKRADRMRDYMVALYTGSRPIVAAMEALLPEKPLGTILRLYDEVFGTAGKWRPPSNVWLGVSAEDQQRADERIPLLLQTPAAVRWVSAEPLLGPLDLYGGDPDPRLGGVQAGPGLSLEQFWKADGSGPFPGVDWVVAGGESGPGSRPAHPDWFRSLRDQCDAADVPFFFKQWGDWYPGDLVMDDDHDGLQNVAMLSIQHDPRGLEIVDGDFKYHEFDDTEGMFRVGKQRAGNMLAGRTWMQWPGEQESSDG